MSGTGKKYFDKKFKDEIWGRLLTDIEKAGSKEEIFSVLAKILTPHEINSVEKRLAVLNLLNKKLTYRRISEIADVHRGTISFVKRGFIKTKNPKTAKKRAYIYKTKEKSASLSGGFRKYRYLRKIS